MSTGPEAGGLHVLKVLIVEDDLMLADFAEEILVEHGYEITGIARHRRRCGRARKGCQA